MPNDLKLRSNYQPGFCCAVLLVVATLTSCGGDPPAAIIPDAPSAAPPASGSLVLSLAPSRTSGVAPLSVFFDATGTTDTALTARPFHDLEYRWNFGDVNAGSWNAGAPGISKNTAIGPVAAHVFETPGIYTVNLIAFDGSNTATTQATITVENPDTVFTRSDTLCFSASGNFTDCPAGAIQTTTDNFAGALLKQAGRKRLLFRRGEIFVVATAAVITSTGPGIIGAYGSGAAPLVRMAGNGTFINLSGPTIPTITDWRIMDLNFDGLGKPGTVGIDVLGVASQILVLNINIHDIGEGIKFNASAAALFDDMAIVGSTITPIANAPSGSRIYASGKRLSIQGNTLNGATMGAHAGSAHLVHIPYMGKGLITNNTLARPGAGMHAIKMHGPTWCYKDSAGGCINAENSTLPLDYSYLTNTLPVGIFALTSGYTEQVIISGNQIIGASNPWTVALGPQTPAHDERLRDIIVERNWFTAGAGTTAALQTWTTDTTIRNNICDMTGASEHTCVAVSQRGVEPPPNSIRVYNNTFYSSSAGDFTGVNISAAASNISVINNLGSAPTATNPLIYFDNGSTGLIQSNNLLNNVPAAVFSNPTPVNPPHFSLSITSPARDNGAAGVLSAPVFSDFFRIRRPQNGVVDIGAIEGP